MTVELAVLISVIGVGLSIWSAVSNGKKDAKNDQAQMTSVLIKLENIQDNTKDIKNDLKGISDDVKRHESRITILEQRVNNLEGSNK